MSDPAPDANLTVSVEQDGRVLSGVGVTKESLQETMDARSIDEKTPAASPPAGSEPASSTPSAGAVTLPSDPPKPTRGQARFSELTQQRDAEKARADAAEKRAADIEARLNQPRASVGVEERTINDPQAGAKPAQSAPQPPQPTRPKPSEDEVGAKYATYGAFVEDQQLWFWEQQQSQLDQRVRQGIEAHTQAQQFQAHVESTRAKGRAAYKDFDAMLQNGPGTYVNMPLPAVQAIYDLPNSEHVQYAIMKDGALAQRLASLAATNPYAFGLELARIAPAAPAASPASTGTPGSATPPPPMQPVGSGSTTTRLSSADHAKAGDYQAYKAARAAERGGTRRR